MGHRIPVFRLAIISIYRVLARGFKSEFCLSASGNDYPGGRGGARYGNPFILVPPAMLVMCHELLPAAYLLILAPGCATDSALALAPRLGSAARGGKPAVGPDCQLLDTTAPTAARLLWACRHCLQQRGAQLVLCRVLARLAQQPNQLCKDFEAAMCLVNYSCEAATQLRSQVGEPHPKAGSTHS